MLLNTEVGHKGEARRGGHWSCIGSLGCCVTSRQVSLSHERFSQVGKEKQCVRLQFSVLDWNAPSMDFYLAKGAQDLTASEGWHSLRFDGEALDKLAAEAPKD